MKPIYLDYAATTPVDPIVVKKMNQFLTLQGAFGNPSSVHTLGQEAKEAVLKARLQVASAIGAEPNDIIWTSGATESNNLALKGVAELYQRKGKHIVTLKTEHKSVLDVCQHLEKKGFEVTYLTPEVNGLLAVQKFVAALRPDTILASIMHVNNETGVIQDIQQLAKITSAKGILFHVDAAQSFGKIPFNVNQTPVDLLSLNAHKIYGPKGIGALYLRKKPRVRVEPLIHGGGHEKGMRSGTLPTHQIVSMGEAFELAQHVLDKDIKKVRYLRDIFLDKLSHLSCLHIYTDLQHAVPHILNVGFNGLLAKAILEKLKIIAASTASACTAQDIESSYVLKAMGLTQDQANSAIRFSFGRFTEEKEIHAATDAILGLF